MKKKLMIFIGMLVFVSVSYADWIGDIKNELTDDLKPLAGDVGAALSGGMAAPCKSGGLFGFNLGLQTSFAGLSQGTKDLKIFTSDTKYFPASWIYVSKGIPGGVDIFARYMSVKANDSDDALTLLGYGLEYNILKDRMIVPIPGVSLILAVNTLSVTSLDVNTTTLGVKVSKKLPVVTPFISFTSNSTIMEIKTVLGTIKPKKSASTIALGAEFRLIPFTYINIAGSKTGEETGIQIALGIKN